MQLSDNGLALIKGFEGFRSKPYLCPAGIPTIGYGSTRYVSGIGVTLKDSPITEEAAAQLLLDTLSPYELCVNSNVEVELTQNQYDALVSFVYNVGQGSFKASTLLKLLNIGDIQGAADQFLRWNKGGGKVLPGLDARRHKERELFLQDDNVCA